MDTLLEAAIVCGLDSRPDSLSVRSLNCYDFLHYIRTNFRRTSQTVCRFSSVQKLVDDVLQVLFACALFISN